MNENPFPGIRSFETHEAHLFYGREKQVDKIVSVLADTHFLALIGYSGSGKSSLIKAGVIPAILDGKIGQQNDWTTTILKPGDSPFHSFALEYTKAYNNIAASSGKKIIDAEETERTLNNSDQPIYDAHKRLTKGSWLIVIDQFEEIFRFSKEGSPDSDTNESQKFVDLFLDVLNKGIQDTPVYIIFTMQSDFLDQCTELSGLTEAINLGHYIIPKMSPKSLQDAIVRPIRENGNTITKELVERLLLDLGDQADQLPIMQHALMRAWTYWSKNQVGDQPIDVSHYEEIGTVSTALSNHAEEIYEEFDTDAKKDLTERLFKALTDIGEGNKGKRRSARFEDIHKLTNCSSTDLIEVIDHFRDPECAFLMPPHQESLYEDTIIDISHESIMHVWKRLQQWVDEETKSAELYLRLSKSAELYQQGKATLWTNPELEIAVKWKLKNNPNAIWADRYDTGFERAIEFLDYSKSESDVDIRKKVNKQKKELKRTRGTVVFLSLASIVSILLLVISLNATNLAERDKQNAVESRNTALEKGKEAEKQSREAFSQRSIASQQQEIADQETEKANRLSTIARENESEANRFRLDAEEKKKDAEDAKLIAVIEKVKADTLRIRADRLRIVADDARKLTEEAKEETMRLRVLETARSMAFKSQKLADEEDSVLAILLAGQAYKFNMDNGGNVRNPDIFSALSKVIDKKPVFRKHTDAVRCVLISDDGNRIYSGSDDGSLLVWNAHDETSYFSLNLKKQPTNGIRSIDVQNGTIIAGSGNGKVLLWGNANKKTAPIIFIEHSPKTGTIVKGVKFISDKLFVSVCTDGLIKVWDMQNTSKPFFSLQANVAVTNVSVSADKTAFACVDNSGIVRIFQTSDLNIESTIKIGDIPLTAVALNHNGKILSTGDQKGRISVWDLGDQPKIRYNFTPDRKSAITALEFSNDTTLASSSYDNKIRIWNPSKEEQPPMVIADHNSWVMDICYNKQGNILASCSNDKTIKLTQVDPEMLSSKVCEKAKRNLTDQEWKDYVGDDIKYKPLCMTYFK